MNNPTKEEIRKIGRGTYMDRKIECRDSGAGIVGRNAGY